VLPGSKSFDPGDFSTVDAQRLPSWVITAFGLSQTLLPNLFLLPIVQPVVDVYRPGVRRLIQIPQPAAGVSAQITVPAAKAVAEEWELLSIFFLVTTDATVTNRNGRVRVQEVLPDGSISNSLLSGVAVNVVASSQAFFTFGDFGTTGSTIVSVAATINMLGMLPNGFRAGPGATIFLDNIGGVAGDQISSALITARVWPV